MNVIKPDSPRANTRIDQVCRFFGEGLVVKEVAFRLGISVSTVMTYAGRIQRTQKLTGLHEVYVWCVAQAARRLKHVGLESNPNSR